MKTTNAQRLRVYKAKMQKAGFRRLSAYMHPDLSKLLLRNRRPSECYGRTLERLLLGKARERPRFR